MKLSKEGMEITRILVAEFKREQPLAPSVFWKARWSTNLFTFLILPSLIFPILIPFAFFDNSKIWSFYFFIGTILSWIFLLISLLGIKKFQPEAQNILRSIFNYASINRSSEKVVAVAMTFKIIFLIPNDLYFLIEASLKD